ncbi:MAG TPA: 3-dehydroquinate synthase II [Polyangiaceae bacterium]|nr:3-dehydroquinate synthase II [Polyangiaceae bacterium]
MHDPSILVSETHAPTNGKHSPRVETPVVAEAPWWFDGRGASEPELWATVARSNCEAVLVLPAELGAVPTGKQAIAFVERVEELERLPPEAWVMTNGEEIRARASAAGRRAGLLIEVHDLESGLPRGVEVCERGDDFVVVDIEHATYIPYELLLAKTEHKKTRILRSVPIKGLDGHVGDIHQSLNAFATLERGVGVLFRSRDPAAVESLTRNVAHVRTSSLPLVPARVVEVLHTGLGHRVCVDTTSMMTAEEGMLVGSTGWGGLFVCSENHYLPHMNLREFRVNAGGVHSYVWGPNDQILYLSEMKAGSEVLCVDLHGNARPVTVGRAKIERRPLVCIRAQVALADVPAALRAAIEAHEAAARGVTPDGEKIAAEPQDCVYVNAFLQNDWHVRLMGADGKVRHSTLVRPGDELLAHVEIPGRHTGLRVTEHILEK